MPTHQPDSGRSITRTSSPFSKRRTVLSLGLSGERKHTKPVQKLLHRALGGAVRTRLKESAFPTKLRFRPTTNGSFPVPHTNNVIKVHFQLIGVPWYKGELQARKGTPIRLPLRHQKMNNCTSIHSSLSYLFVLLEKKFIHRPPCRGWRRVNKRSRRRPNNFK
jgi:hypothetical protein